MERLTSTGNDKLARGRSESETGCHRVESGAWYYPVSCSGIGSSSGDVGVECLGCRRGSNDVGRSSAAGTYQYSAHEVARRDSLDDHVRGTGRRSRDLVHVGLRAPSDGPVALLNDRCVGDGTRVQLGVRSSEVELTRAGVDGELDTKDVGNPRLCNQRLEELVGSVSFHQASQTRLPNSQ